MEEGEGMEEGTGEGMEEGEGVEEGEGMEEWAVYHHRCRLVHPRLPMENEQVVVVPQVVALKTVALKTVQAVGCTAGMNHHHHHHHGHSLAPSHTTNHNHHHCNHHHCNHRPLPPLRGPSFTTNSFPIAATTVCLK